MKQKTCQSSGFPKQAIVLAAGLGTRLRPLTYQIPKPALPVGGAPILFYNLYLLKRMGIKEITINLSHLPNHLKKILRSSRKLGLDIQFSLEKKILGTAGGIAQALRKMKHETTFVLNGDVIFDLNLKSFFSTHHRSKAEATLACVPPKRAKVNGFVEYESKGKIVRIAGEPKSEKKIPSTKKGVFSGAHVIEPSLFESYPPKKFGCVIREIYQPALSKGKRLQAYQHFGDWWDLGNLTEFKRVDKLLWEKKVSQEMNQIWQEVYFWSQKLFS